MVTSKLGAVIIAAIGIAGIAAVSLVLDDGSDADTEAHIQAELPQVKDYSFVALPTAPPPGDAYVETSHNADNYESGQLVMLQYAPFTVYGCAEQIGSPAEGSCAREDRTVLRTVRDEKTVTVWSAATKDLNDPEGTASDLFDQVSAYLDQAKFTTTPPWVRPYAEEQLRTRKYGS